VLLKMNLIQGPEVHVELSGQLSEFFYAPFAPSARHGLSVDVACADGSPVADLQLKDRREYKGVSYWVIEKALPDFDTWPKNK
jgi:hypothetical protein